MIRRRVGRSYLVETVKNHGTPHRVSTVPLHRGGWMRRVRSL